MPLPLVEITTTTTTITIAAARALIRVDCRYYTLPLLELWLGPLPDHDNHQDDEGEEEDRGAARGEREERGVTIRSLPTIIWYIVTARGYVTQSCDS